MVATPVVDMRERSRHGLPFNVDGHRFMGAVEHELEAARRRGVGAFDTQHAAITGEVRQPHGTQHRRQALRKPLTAQTASHIYMVRPSPYPLATMAGTSFMPVQRSASEGEP